MTLHINVRKKLPGFELKVNLSSEREIIGILGASGSGKSMLLRCLAGLVKPDEGEIKINGRTIFDSEKRINLLPRERKVGFLFQNFALFPHLTVAENIIFGLDRLSEADKKDRAAELMDKFHLKDMGTRYPTQISGGQQQRVALARAMAIQPEILLLDEPFSALDEHLRNHMMKEMEGFLKDYTGTTLYVTHNMEEAYRLCNRIAILSAGKVEAFDQKRSLFNFPVSLESAKITGCKNISRASLKPEGMIEIPEWGIQIQTDRKGEDEEGFAGIRANHIQSVSGGMQQNAFPAWISDESETPFRTTLYLKIGSKATSTEDFHIQWEVSHEQMQEIKRLQQPIHITMDSKHVFFVRG